MAIKDIVLKLIIDGKESIITMDKLDSKMKGLSGSSTWLNTSFKNIAASLGLAFGAYQVIDFMKESVALVQRQNEVVGKLNATLKSTEHAAGLSSEELVAMGNNLEELTRFKFDDKDIIDAEGLLLTFKRINKEVFPEAMRLALDLSVRFDRDLALSVTTLGRALSDPIKGIAALRKANILFLDSQTEQIKKLVESNRLLDAQKIILAELSTRVSGSAAASVDEYTFEQNKMNESLEDLKLTLGNWIIPMLSDFARELSNTVLFVDKLAKKLKEIDIPDSLIELLKAGILLTPFTDRGEVQSEDDFIEKWNNTPGVSTKLYKGDTTTGAAFKNFQKKVMSDNLGLSGQIKLMTEKEFASVFKSDTTGKDDKKAVDERKKLYDELLIKSKKGQEKELEQLQQWYDDKLKVAGTSEALQSMLKENYEKEKNDILVKYHRKEIEDQNKFYTERNEQRLKADKKYRERFLGSFVGEKNVPKFDPLGYVKSTEQLYDEMGAIQQSAVSGMMGATDAFWQNFIIGGRQAAGPWDAIWLSFRNSALANLGQIISSGFFKDLVNGLGGASGASGSSEGGSFWDDVWGTIKSFIPFLADGAVINKPTLAMVGEAGAEAVIPLERFHSFNSSMNTDNLEKVISKKLDETIKAFTEKQFEIDMQKMRTVNKRIDAIEKKLTIK